MPFILTGRRVAAPRRGTPVTAKKLSMSATLLAMAVVVGACGGTDASSGSDAAPATSDSTTTESTVVETDTGSDADPDPDPDSGSSGGLSSSTDGDDAGSSGGDDDSTTTDTEPEADPVQPDPTETDVFDLDVGDCFDSLSIDVVSEVDGLSCEAEHLYEIYYAFDIVGESFPGTDAIVEDAQEGCLGAFDGFVGLAFADSILDVSYLYPTMESWTLGDDREVLCLLINVDESPRTGTARGAGV
ncbi:MAG: hypothetical protein ACI8TP_002696 [Acidimicrobiales bacterium]